MGDVRSVYVTSTGLWWESRYRSIAEAISNIVLNIVLGKYFGISGIIIATIFSIWVINFGYGSSIIYRFYFGKEKMKYYYSYQFYYLFVTILVGGLIYYMCNMVSFKGVFNIIFRVIFSIIVMNLCFWMAYKRMNIFRESINIIKTICRR